MIDQKCRLCPRECKAERENGQMGFCGMTGKGIRAARAALHFWEEPCISGKGGSGVPFCRLYPALCLLSEPRDRSREDGRGDQPFTPGGHLFELKEQGAENINLVTPSHYADKIMSAIRMAKREDLTFRLFITAADMRKLKS